MMGDVSKITVVGRLSGDPELKYTDKGTALCTFSIPTHRIYNNNEETTWHRITVWGNTAEACYNWLEKGSVVHVAGRLRVDPDTGGPRIWSGDDGIARASFEVTARDVDFLADIRQESREKETVPGFDAPQEDIGDYEGW